MDDKQQDDKQQEHGCDVGDPTRSPPAPRWLRFNLLSLLLLTAAIASWGSYWRTTHQTQQMKNRLPGLRDVARELVVSDPSQYAAVREHATWNDDFRWQVYLPPGQQYKVFLATSEIASPGSLRTPPPTSSSTTATIAAGRHDLQLRLRQADQQWRISVIADGQTLLSDTRPADWYPQQGSTDVSTITPNLQQSLSTPLMLFWRQFSVRNARAISTLKPDQRSNGIQLWINPVPASQDASDQDAPNEP